MKAHVFFYKWPGIKEGLTHREVENRSWVDEVPAPNNAYIYWAGHWYLRMHGPMNVRYGARQSTTAIQVTADKVPDIFRTHLLLVT